MKAKEIVKVLDELAPPSLAYKEEELGFVIGDGEKEVKVVGATERPTVDVLEEAIKKSVDMLIIHEPLYHSEKSFLVSKSELSFLPNKKRKEFVEKGNFAVFRYHSQWDDTKDGNNEVLARLLEIKIIDKIPYGRIGTIAQTTLGDLANKVKTSLGTDGVLVVGKLNQNIEKVAVVAGSGNSLTEIMEIVKQNDTQVLISGDITDGKARFASEIGLSVIDAGDYFTENPGAKRLVRMLITKLAGVKVIYLDPGQPWQVVA